MRPVGIAALLLLVFVCCNAIFISDISFQFPVQSISEVFGSGRLNSAEKKDKKDSRVRAADSVKPVTEGNTIGNITENGLAVQDGRYRYYTTVNGLLRVEKSTGTQKILDTAYADHLNYYQGWLYYLASGSVRRIHPDGTGRETILEGGRKYNSMYLADGIVYLISEKESGSYIYTVFYGKMDDWHMKEVVSGVAFHSYTICGGWVYYRDAADQYFYKKKADGTEEKVRLSKTYISSPVEADGWIYGCTLQNSICRIAVDGKKEETVCKLPFSIAAAGMNHKEDRICFYSAGDSETKGIIGSVRLDGTEVRQLYTASKAGDYFHSLNFLDGELVAAYCEAYRMTGTVSIDMETGRQVTY